MRNSISQNCFQVFPKISLEDDLPFSMTSFKDKDVLLFPLTFGSASSGGEDNIMSMIERCIPKQSAPEEDKDKEPLVSEFIPKQEERKERKQRMDQKIEFGTSQEKSENRSSEIHQNGVKSKQLQGTNAASQTERTENSVFKFKIDGQKDLRVCEKLELVSSSSESTYNPKNVSNYAPVGHGKKRGPYRKFSQSEKQNLVKEAKKFGIGEIVRREDIARKTLCRWISDGVVRRYGGGRQVGDAMMEEKLMEIIQSHFAQHREVMEKQRIQELARQLSSSSLFTASHGWFQKFYLRHRLEFQAMLEVVESTNIARTQLQNNN